jgi:hypothetical protein
VYGLKIFKDKPKIITKKCKFKILSPIEVKIYKKLTKPPLANKHYCKRKLKHPQGSNEYIAVSFKNFYFKTANDFIQKKVIEVFNKKYSPPNEKEYVTINSFVATDMEIYKAFYGKYANKVHIKDKDGKFIKYKDGWIDCETGQFVYVRTLEPPEVKPKKMSVAEILKSFEKQFDNYLLLKIFGKKFVM